MTDHDQELDRALAALPDPTAPPTLVARVMHSVRESDRRVAIPARGVAPWFAWPVSAQFAAIAFFVAVSAALVHWAPVIQGWWRALQTTGPVTVTRVVWDAIEPAIAGGSIYVVVMGFVVACVTAALSHLAIDGTHSNSRGV